MKRLSIFLVIVTLVAGMVGCGGGDGGNGDGSYTLIVDFTVGGTVAVDDVPLPGKAILTYDADTVVSLGAVPSAGYRFVEWTGNGSTIDDVNAASTTITVNDDYSITANFVRQYDLTISSTAGGSVTAPGEAGPYSYAEGEVVNLVAVADEGYEFTNWTGNVSTVAHANAASTTITMNGGYSITANFSTKINYPYSGSVRLHTGLDSEEYTWFSFVPDDLRRCSTYYILLTAEGGNTDYGATIQNVRGLTTFFSSNPSLSNLICIGVAIPRGEGQGEYAVAMPASVFSDVIDEKFYRPDLKVCTIIEDFTSELESYGIQIHDKVLMWGFSNSAMFAQRYCFLHPEKVKAVAIGQAGGALTMGMDTYSDNELDWPVGTNDFSILTSVDFDVNAYNSIPKFIFIGEEDTGPYQSTVYSPVYGWNLEIFTVDQCQILYDIADTDPIRVQNQSVIMNNNGDNITFEMYPGIGHQFCSQMQFDAGVFFTNIINE